MQSDLLIIGNGIAALSMAFQLTEMHLKRKITIIAESTYQYSNSYRAQGGIAVEFGSKKLKKNHVKDTIRCGITNDVLATNIILGEAENPIKQLIGNGLHFDSDSDGSMLKRKEGGHSERRILFHSDTSGKHIQEFLLSKISTNKNIQIIDSKFCFELLIVDDKCCGAKAIDTLTNEVTIFNSPTTILATGGCGSLYSRTSNSPLAIGSGIVLASSAGAKISNMEFIQFHPTVYTNGTKTILLSEALRGEGARIINSEGHYYEGIELYTRDKLSRLLYAEIKNGKSLFLDCRNVAEEKLNNFQYITDSLYQFGLSLKKDKIPIEPAAHFMCGGIATDIYGWTNIGGLFAIGETADTGLHGANRLASNSLTEAVTVPYFMVRNLNFDSIKTSYNREENQSHYRIIFTNFDSKIAILREKMWQYCGIVKKETELETLKSYLQNEIDNLEKGLNYSKLRYSQMLTTSLLIVESSLKRKVNVGTFWKE